MKAKIEIYNVLKVLAIILVVISHSSYMKILSDYGGIDYILLNDNKSSFLYKLLDKLREIIYYFHMPLFMALSGSFFKLQMNRNKWKEVKSLIINKFYRLMLPFFIFTLVFSYPIKYISSYFTGVSICDGILGQILLLGNSHLWYLYTLFIIFLISYFLIKYIDIRYVLSLAYILHIIAGYIHIQLIAAPLIFLVWFLMGYIFEDYREVIDLYIKKNNIIYILYFLLIFIVLIFIVHMTKSYNYILSRIFIDLAAISGSIFTYCVASLLLGSKLLRNSFYNMILINGLGIYIFSDPLNYLILHIVYKYLGIQFMFSNMGMISLFITRLVGTLFISLLITIIIKKMMPKYKSLIN